LSADQQDSVGSAGKLGPAAFNLDVQLCRHEPVTFFTEFSNNRLCHCGELVEFDAITKILLTLREITKKITKSGHTEFRYNSALKFDYLFLYTL
jgi:hypothetical protein